MIDFSLSEEQEMLQRTARDFAQKEIRPYIVALRANRVEGDRWQAFLPIYKKGVELGFTKLFVPEEAGGLGGSCLDAAILLEELGAADVGIAADYFSLTMNMPLLMMRGGRPEQLSGFLNAFVASDSMVLAGAQSEPNVAGSELMCAGPNPAFGPKMSAVKDGDVYLLNGQKSAFITNAGVADKYFIIARTDPGKPVMEGLSIFLVEADTPGLTIGKETELIGWKATHHAELYFDNARVPATNLIGPEGSAAMTFASVPEMGICLAACFVGLARAAYEYALAYAKERQSLGQPLIAHQAVALKLADMAVDLHTARLTVWNAASACASNPQQAATFYSPAAKTVAVDVAIRNAEATMKILGGYATSREYEAGHFLNDAWVGYACDFTRDILRLGMVHFL
jgi:alkylation response protein AidB-like acyl-CoA dehydrogenase